MDEFADLLQVNGKGWNENLFVSKLPNISCASCKHICKDAVELGCEHEDAEIDAFCKQCLSEVLETNNNKCPINSSHVNPPVVSARTLRRQILSLKVHCPNSEAYSDQNKQNDPNYISEDANVFDTADEKEGGNFSYKQEHKQQCHWSGTLKELVSDHIKNCTVISGDIIYSKIKQLKQKISEIAQKIDAKDKSYNDTFMDIQTKLQNLQSVFNQQKATDDKLAQKELQILNLQQQVDKNTKMLNNLSESFKQYQKVTDNKLIAKDQQILKLQQKLESTSELFKKQQNESAMKYKNIKQVVDGIITVTEEKKVDNQQTQNENESMDSWNVNKKGPKISIIKHKATLTTDGSWNTVYGNRICRPGNKYRWKMNVSASGHVMIGVVSTEKDWTSTHLQNHECWILNSWSFNCNTRFCRSDSGSKTRSNYGRTLKMGDLVEMNLDLVKFTISFCIDGTDYGIAWDNLPSDMSFYMAACFGTKGDSIEVLPLK